MYPERVNIDKKAIDKLIALYTEAQAQITKEIETATNFGVQNRKAILAQIKNYLTDLNQQAQPIIQDTITNSYEKGADQAVQQLDHVAADVQVAEGFNRIHKDAIAALVDDTARAFGEGMSGVNREAGRMLGKVVREKITQQLAFGKVSGKALKDIQKTVIGEIKQSGLSALQDRAGRSWTLDRYTEMLIRTKSVEARNRGLVNRTSENGYDLVQVSSHGASDVCADWEGEILSLTGETPGYPTVDEAEADGLFHPNCQHAINVLSPYLADKTNAYDNPFNSTGEEN